MKNKKVILQVTIFLVGMCSIIYELLVSTVSSYFIGDSVKSFSLVIGFYMASMGLGSYLSKYINKNLILSFINVEIILGAIGALSVPLLYSYFSYADFYGFRFVVLLIVCIIGTLTGLEIPLISRILEDDYKLKENLAQVLSLDYAGALLATLIFPFFFVPMVGNLKTALFFGLLNITVGLANYWFFRAEIGKKPADIIKLSAAILIPFLLTFFALSNDYIKYWNQNIFKYPVIFEKQSPYQKVTLTKHDKDVRLYLNNAIQFSSRDEHRYHEAITHIPLSNVYMESKGKESPAHNVKAENVEGDSLQAMSIEDRSVEDRSVRVLVLGGGEGLVARELLRHKGIAHIDVIDIDPLITELAQKNPVLKEINKDAMNDPRVRSINEDAFNYLNVTQDTYDLIIADLPDPNTEILARLYSSAFFRLIKKHLTAGGVFVTQATSPELSPDAFWCIYETLKFVAFNHLLPYNINVPSFGNWGFIMASDKPIKNSYKDIINSRSLDGPNFKKMQIFPKEFKPKDTKINHLDQPILLDYYLGHWETLIYEKR